MNIFLIQGSAGQWDDYHTWIVCGGFDKNLLQLKCDSLNKEAKSKFDKGKDISESCQKDEYDYPINLTDEELELHHYYSFGGLEHFQIIETTIIS